MADGDDSNLGRFASLGLQVGVSVALGAWLGWWLDKKYPSMDPWGVVAGSMLGFASGMYILIKEAMRANKD